MKQQLDDIRKLLDQIEATSVSAMVDSFERNFDALELPDIIGQIVDFLQPNLLPIEAAIYWHLFRHCVVAHGSQHVRASVRGLGSGVVKSNRGQSEKLVYGTIQEALKGLEEKGAIRKAGDTTREGTLYFVSLPEEIPLCLEQMKSAALKGNAPSSVDEKRELDFYNVAENRLKIFERDNYRCYKCGKLLTRFSATLDHIQPVSKGGDHSYENLVTACLHDNSRRGDSPIMDALGK